MANPSGPQFGTTSRQRPTRGNATNALATAAYTGSVMTTGAAAVLPWPNGRSAAPGASPFACCGAERCP